MRLKDSHLLAWGSHSEQSFRFELLWITVKVACQDQENKRWDLVIEQSLTVLWGQLVHWYSFEVQQFLTINVICGKTWRERIPVSIFLFHKEAIKKWSGLVPRSFATILRYIGLGVDISLILRLNTFSLEPLVVFLWQKSLNSLANFTLLIFKIRV